MIEIVIGIALGVTIPWIMLGIVSFFMWENGFKVITKWEMLRISIVFSVISSIILLLKNIQ